MAKKPINANKEVICLHCKHYATKETQAPSMFLLYGCRKHRRQFGIFSDVAKIAPTSCTDFIKPSYQVSKTWDEAIKHG